MKNHHIFRWLWVLALLLSQSLFCKAEESSSDDEVDLSGSVNGVVILTSTNFEKHIGDGNVWLVEFYAPWW